VASAVDDARCAGDHGRRRGTLHAAKDPLNDLVTVAPAVLIVPLDLLGPEEHPGDPLKLRRAVTDCLRVPAEVDVPVAVGLRPSGAEVEVELPKVAWPGSLDHAAPPPAAALHVGAGTAAKVRGRRVRAAGASAQLPAALPLSGVVAAHVVALYVRQVLVEVHAGVGIALWADRVQVVPPGSFADL